MIVTVGSINVDQISEVDAFPTPGETVICTNFTVRQGGKGANQALAARRAGAEVTFVGCVGRDQNAEYAIDNLVRAGVDMTHVSRLDGEVTGTALITVDRLGENNIIIVAGANACLSPQMIEEAFRYIPKNAVVLLQQEIPRECIETVFKIAHEKSLRTCLNIAPFLPSMRDLAVMADYLVCNQLEFSALIGGNTVDNIESIAQGWSQKHGQSVIVTLGNQGALAVTSQSIIRVPVQEILLKDSVGAGDCFCGYFAAAIAKNQSLADAVELAVIASGMSCESQGAQTSTPFMEKVVGRLARANS